MKLENQLPVSDLKLPLGLIVFLYSWLKMGLAVFLHGWLKVQLTCYFQFYPQSSIGAYISQLFLSCGNMLSLLQSQRKAEHLGQYLTNFCLVLLELWKGNPCPSIQLCMAHSISVTLCILWRVLNSYKSCLIFKWNWTSSEFQGQVDTLYLDFSKVRYLTTFSWTNVSL